MQLALRSYAAAADLAAHSDWQPRWRLGLLMQAWEWTRI